ncbi:MAG: flagellar assembly protein FliW [Firmicutes bacterium HGW-Firmicutes-15]|nr:MAG: flagellar assembly protein FliW [Firmicutes bacterium HGW-Firmicutes-15]
MEILSSLLGELEFDESFIISFPQGIPAFEEEKKFVLLPMDGNGPFYYLQSVKNPDLCLLVAEPFTFFPDYEIDINDEYLKTLGIKEEEQQMSIYLILTVPEDFKMTTANLIAPLVINTDNRQGIQYIAAKTNYTTRHHIFRPEQKTASGGEGR